MRLRTESDLEPPVPVIFAPGLCVFTSSVCRTGSSATLGCARNAGSGFCVAVGDTSPWGLATLGSSLATQWDDAGDIRAFFLSGLILTEAALILRRADSICSLFNVWDTEWVSSS